MKKSNALIVYSSNPQEIYDRRSAIGSYIYQLSICLKELNIHSNLEKNDNIKEFPKKTNKNFSISNWKKNIPKGLVITGKEIRDLLRISKLLPEYESYISKHKAEYIIEFYNKFSNIGYKLKNSSIKKYILVYDGPIDEESKFFNGREIFFYKIYKSRERKSLIAADIIIVYSEPMKDYLCKKHGEFLRRKIMIHQNVDFSRLNFYDRPDEERPSIGFLGSFLKWHRVDLLVKVFERLKKTFPNIQLYLVGDGQTLPEIKKQVVKSLYKEDIFITGFVDGEELYLIKKKFNIGVMPSSSWYQAPNKIFEYGAMGMSVIAPESFTISDIFQNNENILLFQNQNEGDLYEKLFQLLEKPEFRRNLRKSLYHKVKIDHNKESTIRFYNKIISN